MTIAQSITDLIGNTPLLRLNNLGRDVSAEVVAKCEFMNPISVKDRPVFNMIKEAEARGDIAPGDTLVEATSGNTGMALTYIGIQRGYKVILCMSEIQSIERRNILRALGAEVVLTPKAGGTKAAKQKAEEIHAETPRSFYVSQHHNLDNRAAHTATTGEEIWRDTEGKVDAFVAAMGTCGTICGTSAVLKKNNPTVHIVGVEPAEAPILSKGEWKPHRMMGTAPGFIPGNLDRARIDEMLPVSEADAFATCRRLAREEGILVGISSGATAFAALQLAARPEFKGKRIICVFADSGERYLSVEGLFA